ncbi:outer membrane protein assembly factor BamC [Lonepinella sp. BR2357]|uniref:outer membrane protein assembly factor BamC n=1 Tax=Lonepinella sp. BR2357 TaxID=3434549 RepID=UPI003F6DA548
MKKWLLAFTVLATVTACSTSNESKQTANDSYEKRGIIPVFTTLDTGGVTILGQENTYQLPTNVTVKTDGTDIRPPSTPMAIIGNSVAQFDGERSSIVYPAEKKAVYNIQQVKRLLTEQGIPFTTSGNQVQTDWAKTGRADDVGDVQARYIIEEVGTSDSNALVVALAQMKRDEVIFTPTVKDKERYTSDRLNQLVGELNAAYRQQQQQVATADVAAGAVQSAIVTDSNQHTALAMNITFRQAWQKLQQALPQLGFEYKESTAGKGYALLKYKPLDDTEWARFGLTKPDLEKGEYSMQISAYGNESAVVISDEDKFALSGEKAQTLYQALQKVLSK